MKNYGIKNLISQKFIKNNLKKNRRIKRKDKELKDYKDNKKQRDKKKKVLSAMQ